MCPDSRFVSFIEPVETILFLIQVSLIDMVLLTDQGGIVINFLVRKHMSDLRPPLLNGRNIIIAYRAAQKLSSLFYVISIAQSDGPKMGTVARNSIQLVLLF